MQHEPLPEPGPLGMNESISEIQRLLHGIVSHLKAGTSTEKRKAVAKLERIAVVASHDQGSNTGVVLAMRGKGIIAWLA